MGGGSVEFFAILDGCWRLTVTFSMLQMPIPAARVLDGDEERLDMRDETYVGWNEI